LLEDENLLDDVNLLENENKLNIDNGYSNLDYMILYELGKEVVRAENREILFDVVLFSVMGQIGASSSSILIPDDSAIDRWIVADSRGVRVRSKELFFNTNHEITQRLIDTKELIDLEIFKNKIVTREEYYKYISIDTRLIIPLVLDDVVGAIVVGDKLEGEYSENDKKFIIAVGEIFAIALKNYMSSEIKENHIHLIEQEMDAIKQVEQIQKKILNSSNLKSVNEIIQFEMKSMGIDSYAFYMIDLKNSVYSLQFCEKEDFLLLKEKAHTIPVDSIFTRSITNIDEIYIIENFETASIVSDIYSSSQINKMSIFRLFPVKLGNTIIGYITLFRVKDFKKIGKVDGFLKKIAKIIFSYIHSIQKYDINQNRYIDNSDSVNSRIDKEIKKCDEMNIPLTMVIFSIKNYKRYYNIYGYEELQNIFHRLETIIRERLSDRDFAIRIDRHKVMLILPGKDKRYTVPLANIN